MRRDAPQRMQPVPKTRASSGKSKPASRGLHQPDKAHGKPKELCNKRSAFNGDNHHNNIDAKQANLWSPKHDVAPTPPTPPTIHKAKVRHAKAAPVVAQNHVVREANRVAGARKSAKPSLKWYGGKVNDSDSEDGERDLGYGRNPFPGEHLTLSMALDQALFRREASRQEGGDLAHRGAPCEREAQALAGAKRCQLQASALALVKQALRECEKEPVVAGELPLPSPAPTEESEGENAELELPEWYCSLLRDEAQMYKWEAAICAHVHGSGVVKKEIEAGGDLDADPKVADSAMAGCDKHDDVLQDIFNGVGGDGCILVLKNESEAPACDELAEVQALPNVEKTLGHVGYGVSVLGKNQTESGDLEDGADGFCAHKEAHVAEAVAAAEGDCELDIEAGDDEAHKDAAEGTVHREPEALQFESLESTDFEENCVAVEDADDNAEVESEDDAGEHTTATDGVVVETLFLEAELKSSVVKLVGQEEDAQEHENDDGAEQRIDAFKAECEVLKEAIDAGETKTGGGGDEAAAAADLLDIAADSDSDDESWSGVELSEVDDESEEIWEDDWCLVDEFF